MIATGIQNSNFDNQQELIDDLIRMNQLEAYNPPKWVTDKIAPEFIPSTRLNIALKPTPIQKWNLPGVPKDFELYVKRDDLNGSVLGGNKIRKLEFSIAEALKNGCDHIITWGTIKSNHCRTTALLCAQLGLKCTLLQTSDSKPENLATQGNVMLSMLTDANCYICPSETTNAEADEIVAKFCAAIHADGEKPYVLGRGGTEPIAVFAYLDAFEEMRKQDEKLMSEITDIFVTSGSGGTAVSLGLAAHLTNSDMKVHGCRAWGDNQIFGKILEKELVGLGMNPEEYKFPVGHKHEGKQNLVHSHDFMVCGGYGNSCPEINEIALKSPRTTGVPLCTVYTGKTVAAMLNLMKNKPEVFNGRKVMFVHTGGIPGLWGDTNLTGLISEKFKKQQPIQPVENFFNQNSNQNSDEDSALNSDKESGMEESTNSMF